MNKLTAIAIPILPGKTEQWKKFANDLKTRYNNEFKESRKSLGITERAFLQKNPTGDLVIVTQEGENPVESFKKLGQKTDEFTKWFVSQVKEIHGIDISKPEALPPFPELVVESEPIEEHAMH